jgi:hypothetical protein
LKLVFVLLLPTATTITAATTRTSRWWFSIRSPAFAHQALDIVDCHPASITGVYLYADFSIDKDGAFRHPPFRTTLSRIRPFLQRNLTVSLALYVHQSAIQSGCAISNPNGISAVAAHAARLNVVTSLMVDYEPSTNYTPAHVNAYATFLEELAKELRKHNNNNSTNSYDNENNRGCQLDMCVSNWGILDRYGVYSAAAVDGMMSMSSTYYGSNIALNEKNVLSEIVQNVSFRQLRVGIGSTNSIFFKWDYQWTPAKFDQFLDFLKTVRVRHIDIWRTDISTLNATNGTVPWVYDGIANFLAESDDGVVDQDNMATLSTQSN